MWVLRFDKLKPKDYNYIKRQTKKAGFISRKIPDIIFVKSCLFHLLQKKSWRAIGIKLGINHIMLFLFYKKYCMNDEIIKIFHHFVEVGIIVFIENKASFKMENLDCEKFLIKSKIELKNTLV